MSINILLNAEDQIECTEEFAEEVAVQRMVEDILNEDNEEVESDPDEVASHAMPPIAEPLKAIAVVKRLLGENRAMTRLDCVLFT